MKSLRKIIREELARSSVSERLSEYDPSYSVLTIHFGPGSDPQALSIPYRRWDNRTDISVPLRVTREGTDVQPA